VQLWAHAEHYGLDPILSEGLSHGQRIGTVRITNPFAGRDPSGAVFANARPVADRRGARETPGTPGRSVLDVQPIFSAISRRASACTGISAGCGDCRS